MTQALPLSEVNVSALKDSYCITIECMRNWAALILRCRYGQLPSSSFEKVFMVEFEGEGVVENEVFSFMTTGEYTSI